MDGNRCRDYIVDTNETRTHPSYMGREVSNDIKTSQNQYYNSIEGSPVTTTAQGINAVVSRTETMVGEKRKICGCGKNIACNDCCIQAIGRCGEAWTTTTAAEHSQRRDHLVRSELPVLSSSSEQPTRKSIRLSPIFVQQQMPHLQQSMATQIALSNMVGSCNSSSSNRSSSVGTIGSATVNNRSSYWNPGVCEYINDNQQTISVAQPPIDINMSQKQVLPSPIIDNSLYNTPDFMYNTLQSQPAQLIPSIGKIIPQQQHQLSPPQLMVPITNTKSIAVQQRASGSMNASIYPGVSSVALNREHICGQSKYSSNEKIMYQTNTSSNIPNTSLYESNTHLHCQQQQQQQQRLPYLDHLQHNPLHPQQSHPNAQTIIKNYPKTNHVINPSNLPAPKDQHPSPNYARKCPQIFSTEEQSVGHHHHLYMSTPQFSSDKFTRTSPQKQNQTELLTNYNSKLKEASCEQEETSGVASTNGNIYTLQQLPLKYNKLREPAQQQHQYPGIPSGVPISSTYLSHASSSANYYSAARQQIPSKILSREAMPMVMKKQLPQHAYYQQFSQNALGPPSVTLSPHHQQSMSIASKTSTGPDLHEACLNTQSPEVEYIKREDMHHDVYDNHSRQSVQASRNICVNPYNTPPPTTTDTYCKEIIPPNSSLPYAASSSTTPSCRVDSPLCYPTKYAKLSIADSLTHPLSSKNHSVFNQNTPPPSRAPSQRSQQQAGYYYDGNYHSVPSPAIASVASPSPSSLLSNTSQTQLHHSDYIVSQKVPPTSSVPPSPRGVLSPYAQTQQHQYHQNSSIPDTCNNHDKLLTSPPLQQLYHSHNYEKSNNHHPLANQQQQLQSSASSQSKSLTGKHQKPNYRELINEKIAERNATSEEELNLQIIKKALNVNPQIVRNTLVVGGTHSTNRAATLTTETTTVALVQQSLPLPPSTNNERVPLVRQEILIQPQSKSMSSSISSPSHAGMQTLPCLVGETGRVIIEQGNNKSSCSSASPLDLSMRTVKTKADSTEYKYQQKQHYHELMPPSPPLPLQQQKQLTTHPKKYRSTPSSNQVPDSRYTLPRVDFTPNFSLHTLESALLSKDINLRSNKANVPEQFKYTQCTSVLPQNYLNNHNVNHYPPTPTSHNEGVAYPPLTNLYTPLDKEELQNTSATKKCNVKPIHNKCVQNPEVSPILQMDEKKSPITQCNIDFRCAATAIQSRPSVVETNPYASVIKMESTKHTEKQHPLTVVDRLPPDTSIMALPCRSHTYDQVEKCYSSQTGTVITATAHFPTKRQTQSAYNLACEKNPNFLGRKRHLQEYSNQTLSRDSQTSSYVKVAQVSHVRPTDISVIAVNERNNHELQQHLSLHSLKKTIPTCPKVDVKTPAPILTPVITTATIGVPLSSIEQSPMSPIIYKQESVSPLPREVTRIVVTKTEPIITGTGLQQQAAARIRTKAELKGFTFNMPPVLAPTTTTSSIQNKMILIKEEDIKTVEIKIEDGDARLPSAIELPSIPGLSEKFNENNLLDFGFKNTCKNFMEQLQTRTIPYRRAKVTVAISSNNNITSNNLSTRGVITEKVAKEESLRLSHNESPETTGSSVHFYGGDGDSPSMNLKSTAFESQNSSQTSSTTPKKMSKSERERKRFQQEKRLAERLRTTESSSESGDELDKRKTERLKKPPIKSKTHKTKNDRRARINNKSITFKAEVEEKSNNSECGSGSTNDNDESEFGKASKLEQSKNTLFKYNVKEAVQSKKDREEKAEDKKSTSSRVQDEKTPGNMKRCSINGKYTTKPIVKEQESNEESVVDDSVYGEEKEEIKIKNDRKKPAKKLVVVNMVKRKGRTNKICGQSIKFNKLGLHTMTRSKLKKELETQLANSKVLRNDKIIRNSTSKIKRKYVRKYSNNPVGNILTDVAGGLSREAGIVKSTRLKAKLEHNSSKTRMCKKDKVNSECRNETKNLITISAKDGEEQRCNNDLMLEVYRFKRALKVPPSLITIKHPGDNSKIATSLPDMERHAEAKKKKSLIKTDYAASSTPKAASYSTPHQLTGAQKNHISIIDLLHSRVTKFSGTSFNARKKSFTSPYKSNSLNSYGGVHSETSQTTESSELQMLPALKKDSDDEDDDDNESQKSGSKKRHFSIFDTKVLPAKTRNETKKHQKRENIREIFVGDDRPASAPPEMTQISVVNGCSGDLAKHGYKRMTYEQKYEQFLQQMNVVINEDKLGRFNRLDKLSPGLMTSIAKTGIEEGCIRTVKGLINEEDIEGSRTVDVDESNANDNNDSKNKNTSQSSHKELGSTVCIVGEVRNYRRRRRPGKYLRRKGSSGFDYIKKKKKKTPSTATAVNNSLNVTTTITAALSRQHHMERLDDERARVKTEDDVSREMQKWVLNKGVGQSTMHKAARQGYIDVIVYCLDRLGMNPDQKDNAGYTPLHEASTNGRLNIARVLLQYGANHSAAAHSGIRPLHEASENDHEEIVRLLLSYGADPLLATYSGQTPIMLAASSTVRDLLKDHLADVQSIISSERKPWKFNGPWYTIDPTECGYNVLEGTPTCASGMRQTSLRKNSLTLMPLQAYKKSPQRIINVYNTTALVKTTTTTTTTTTMATACTTNIVKESKFFIPTINDNERGNSVLSTLATTSLTSLLKQQQIPAQTIMDKCAVVLDNIDRFSTFRLLNESNPEILVENSDSEGEIVEFEESDVLLPPLYLLKDESNTDKWVLLSDLCNLLKVKSKETLLNKIYPPSSNTSTVIPKGLMRELKTSDFLEKTTCLQLLCAGEKLNLNASKVVLIKYNENVRNLLGVNAFLMKF